MLFVGCQKNDGETLLQQTEQEDVAFLKLVSNETTSMFSSVIGDLNNEFRSLSPSKLSNFDAETFTEKSILNYSKTSQMLSPHFEEIEQVFEQDQLEKTPGTKFDVYSSQNYSYASLQEQEQGFVLEIQNAFSLMPDIDAFKNMIASINVRISNEISEESTRLKLLTISATSEATGVYWAENQEQILTEMRSAAEHWSGKHSAVMQRKFSGLMYGATSGPPNDGDGGSTCCFQGEFQWSWGDFGSTVVGGAVGGAAWAAFANLVPGLGQVAWGASIVGGAVTGGGAYAGYQFTQWMFSAENNEDIIEEVGDQDDR